MDNDLLTTVLDRLDRSSAPAVVGDLLLAALDGDAELATVLEGSASGHRWPDS